MLVKTETFRELWAPLVHTNFGREIHMDQSLVHTFTWGNSYGPMVLKLLLKFPPYNGIGPWMALPSVLAMQDWISKVRVLASASLGEKDFLEVALSSYVLGNSASCTFYEGNLLEPPSRRTPCGWGQSLRLSLAKTSAFTSSEAQQRYFHIPQYL